MRHDDAGDTAVADTLDDLGFSTENPSSAEAIGAAREDICLIDHDIGRSLAFLRRWYYPEAEAVVALIRRSGGLAVLAHPGQSLRGREELLGELIDAELDGIEAFSSYHSASENALFERAARDAGLLATCGSDFHGKTKPAIRLGRMGFSSAGERRRFEAPILERLFPR